MPIAPHHTPRSAHHVFTLFAVILVKIIADKSKLLSSEQKEYKVATKTYTNQLPTTPLILMTWVGLEYKTQNIKTRLQKATFCGIERGVDLFIY